MAKVRLGDIATVVTKGTTPTTMGFQFEDGGINFVKIESISEDGNFLKEKFSHISDECNVQMRRSQLQENDILFSIAGAIGRSAIVTKEILPANTNQALAIIRVPKGKIDYNYLLYALSSSAINQQATQHQQGVAQLNISLKNVSDFLLPIYTEAMQKRIVHNLKKIDKLIFLRKQQLAKLDELVKVRFVEMFGERSSIRPQKLKEVTRRVKVGFVGTCEKYYTDNTGVPMLRTTNITSHGIDLKDLKYVTRTFHEKNLKSRVHKGDLLIARHGSNGQANVYCGDEAQCLNAIIIEPDHNITNPIFLENLINSRSVKRQIEKELVGSTQHVLNTTTLANVEVKIPAIKEQQVFAAFVERVDQQKQTVQQSLEKLELMKKALMQEYFG